MKFLAIFQCLVPNIDECPFDVPRTISSINKYEIGRSAPVNTNKTKTEPAVQAHRESL